jgi:hypothetical protein
MRSLELHHGDPRVLMVFDVKSECLKCGESYWLVEDDKPAVCVNCCLIASERDFIILFGWKIMMSAKRVIACRL